MNATPVRKPHESDLGESVESKTVSGKSSEIDGQDIFVDDDPVLAARRAKLNDEPVRNSGVTADLKSEKLAYIHQMLVELRKLGQTIDEPMIAYLIEMALIETDTALNVGQFRDEFSTKPDRGV